MQQRLAVFQCAPDLLVRLVELEFLEPVGLAGLIHDEHPGADHAQPRVLVQLFDLAREALRVAEVVRVPTGDQVGPRVRDAQVGGKRHAAQPGADDLGWKIERHLPQQRVQVVEDVHAADHDEFKVAEGLLVDVGQRQ